MSELSKTQIDKLGERLKKGAVSEADLRLLDEFRLSFSVAYEFVVVSIRQKLNLEPTGRPAKSTPSIVDKLKRESIRLTQMQDIAGCRLVVSDLKIQDEIVASIKKLFSEVEITDRRIKPSHGYRAVHAVVKHDRKLVEVQIRTSLQHLWAEFSEKMADQLDSALKYGRGDQLMIKTLLSYSSAIARAETVIEKLGKKQGRTEPGKRELEAELKSIETEVSEGTRALIAIMSQRRKK